MSDWSVNAWLRKELPKHTDVLTRMREQLETQLDVDINEHGTASRDWCRLFARYQSAVQALVSAEAEKVKMQLLAKRAGMASLTDEEYEREMIELGREAVRELSTEELGREFLRRGMSLPVGSTESADPD